MCELFLMCSSIAEEVSFSLNEFSKHGGLTDLHKDGWGIAYYDDNDVRIIKEACTASKSSYLKFVKDLSIHSKIVISHIRLATKGEVSIRNTQPLSRELGGKQHVFAHNGDLVEIENKAEYKTSRFRPIGNTDSELAFCYLMEGMSKIWNQQTPPDLASRFAVFSDFIGKIKTLGIANIIYSDSDYVFIHSHKRISPEGDHLPGLFMTTRHCATENNELSIKGLQLDSSKLKEVVLIASVPLSDKHWYEIPEGEMRVLKNGQLISDIGDNIVTQ